MMNGSKEANSKKNTTTTNIPKALHQRAWIVAKFRGQSIGEYCERAVSNAVAVDEAAMREAMMQSPNPAPARQSRALPKAA